MSINQVGVIGLGNMGLPMATTLARAGFKVWGFDLDEGRRTVAAAQAIHLAPLGELLHTVDAVVCSLPRASDVEAVLAAPNALPTRHGHRLLVLDTSTSDPATTRRLARRLGKAGHGHLDAPVSGGPAGAAAGRLTMMLGGAPEDVATARPVIDALATKAFHVGPSGAGNVAKLVNNMLVAAHMLTTGEALRLAEAAGVDAQAVLAVVNAATGRSAISEVHFPTWVLPGHDSGFSAGLMRKDVNLAAELAHEAGLDLPLSREVARLWDTSRAQIPDTEDFTRMAGYTRTHEGPPP